MSDQRPMPVVIGSAESALRALLESILVGSAIPDHDAWVGANGLANGAGEISDDVVQRLQGRHVIDDDKHLTDFGMTELQRLREVVGAVTAGLVAGLDDEHLNVTRAVLATIHARAASHPLVR